MQFDQVDFWIFFAALYAVYLVLPRLGQNCLLLLGSYLLYATWNPWFLLLILGSTLVDYAAGLGMSRETHRREWLITSIIVNLGLLGTFKYFNWFADGFVDLMAMMGLSVDTITVRLVVPIGISFYTFQTMAYSIDVYQRRVEPCRNFLDYALFVSFFPQLLAGPIERTRRLLPQIQQSRTITLAHIRDGQWLIVWGLFKKVFIADNLSGYLNTYHATASLPHGFDTWLFAMTGSIVFFCDFSAYSDMARGFAKLMGIDLSINFDRPYLARNPSQLWNRWHITLSHWFRDYVFAPLASRTDKRSRWRAWLALPTMGLVGLWHGAQWTFVIWGLAWGTAIASYQSMRPALSSIAERTPAMSRWWGPLGVVVTFSLWTAFGPFFVRGSLEDAVGSLVLMTSDFTHSADFRNDVLTVVYYTLPIFFVSYLVKMPPFRTGDRPALGLVNQTVVTLILVLAMLVDGGNRSREFIYFGF